MTTPLGRFMNRVDHRGEGCWRWTGAISDTGYGSAWLGKQRGSAHRLMFELYYGPVPDGLQLDHICRNRWCVNPEHLEPVTQRENTRRGVSPSAKNATATHCPRDHEFTPENTYIRPGSGNRMCRKCQQLRRDRGAALGYRPRNTTCPRGHEVAGDNLRLSSQGYAFCVACRREQNREAERRRTGTKPENYQLLP